MLTRFLFKRMSVERKVKFLKKRGIELGTRLKDGRLIHMYMFRNLFAEIIYRNDDPSLEVEHFSTISGLDELNQMLEKEFRKSNSLLMK